VFDGPFLAPVSGSTWMLFGVVAGVCGCAAVGGVVRWVGVVVVVVAFPPTGGGRGVLLAWPVSSVGGARRGSKAHQPNVVPIPTSGHACASRSATCNTPFLSAVPC